MIPASPPPSAPWSGKGTYRTFHLPRLPREYYQADAVIHWTLPIALRATGWLTETFHVRFREIMLHAAARQGLLCPTYCLMPDHLHLVWMGLRLDTDQRQGMKFLREHLGFHLRPHRFQHLAHDHVLRQRERQRGSFARVCGYILENPSRANRLDQNGSWPFRGALVPGYPTLHPRQDDFWRKFWRIHQQTVSPDAGCINRPPIG